MKNKTRNAAIEDSSHFVETDKGKRRDFFSDAFRKTPTYLLSAGDLNDTVAGIGSTGILVEELKSCLIPYYWCARQIMIMKRAMALS